MNSTNRGYDILVIDDEKQMCISLEKLLEKNNFNVHLANSAKEGLEIIQKNNVDLIICDIIMPDMGGISFLSRIGNRIPVIMMTAYSSVESARKAFKLGACDYLVKPFDFEELVVVIDQNLQNLSNKECLKPDNIHMESNNIEFINILKEAEKFSNTDMPILICGESGTGKEILANYIHSMSKRSTSPYVKINCAAIPDSLLESELFGYEKGAFTGAYEKKLGKFEVANGGTIFLDEIGDMDLSLQAKLLRVLENFEFMRLGGKDTIRLNIRVITASNHDLLELVRKNKFRKDLFHRLNGIYLNIPPLRARKEDIVEFSCHFLKKFNEKYHKKIQGFEDKTLSILKKYDWPGNLRELKNLIERAVVICDSQIIRLFHLPDNIKNVESDNIKQEDFLISEKIEHFRKEYMKQVIIEALDKAEGNKTEASKILKISRKTLYNWMKELGIKHAFT